MNSKTLMEANGLFLNRSFQLISSTRSSSENISNSEERDEAPSSEKSTTLIYPHHLPAVNRAMTRSSTSSFGIYSSSSSQSQPQNHSQLRSTMILEQEEGAIMSTSQNFHCQPQQYRKHHQYSPKSKNKCSSTSSRFLELPEQEDEGVEGQRRNYYSVKREECNNNENMNNNNNYSIRKTTMSSSTSSIVENLESPVRATKKFKSKSGVEQTLQKDGDDAEAMQLDEEDLTTLPTSTSSSSPLSWKLPSFLCLPFTNNDTNNSYKHLMTSTRNNNSSGILSLTSLVLVVIAVLLASVPAPVMSATATESGDSSLVTDEILNNDVTSHDYPGTTSSSIMPVKLQTITFTSSDGTTSEDSALPSSAATGRTTGGGTGPSVTHQSVEGLRQEPSMNDFAGWRDADSLTGHSIEVETSSDKGEHHEDSLLHKEYEFKSGYPELKNETREALQEEGSNHQPVVFVGGSGYVPPNSLRTRPSLEADPLWESRPVAESRYPVPLQSSWDRNYRNPFNMTRVQHIEAECQDDFMKIRVAFNGSFHGLIYSSGYSYDEACVYINGTGRDYYEYLIKLNRCGTLGASNQVEGRREPSKNFMWNTVTVQYNPMIEEEWDEHFKVTCEYGYDFWKTVTFPFLEVGVPTGNPVVFTLTPPECYMEVRYGFGTAGTRVGGPVRVGDPLTLMINMRSQYDGFDIVVNDCYAHNGATKRIQLIDHYGCPVDSKLMSPFRGTWSHSNLYETQVYAYLKTFRFTGSPALYIECDVRMCHGQCPSQPCYWRNVKSVSKRSTDTQMMVGDSEKNTSLSENLSLFQALRVLQEDEDPDAQKTSLSTSESVCMKTGAFTAMIALSTLILVVLTVSTMIMCFRIRREKLIEERETSADILRPYSHHVSQPSQHRHHHWSSAKPR